jgi:metal-responsive CopG/Arc/MetJ family transcriptional regulator
MTERIAISLDAPLLRAIERERKRLRMSRSEFMRHTTQSYFDAIERKRLEDQAALNAVASDAFADNPW